MQPNKVHIVVTPGAVKALVRLCSLTIIFFSVYGMVQPHFNSRDGTT